MRTRSLPILTISLSLSTIISLSTLAVALVVPDPERTIACKLTATPSNIEIPECLKVSLAAYDHPSSFDMIENIPSAIAIGAASSELLSSIHLPVADAIMHPAHGESIFSAKPPKAEYLTSLGEPSPATHDDNDHTLTTASPTTTSISSQYSGSGTGTAANKLAQTTAILSKLDSDWLGRKRAIGAYPIATGQEMGIERGIGMNWDGAREMDDESDQPYWD